MRIVRICWLLWFLFFSGIFAQAQGHKLSNPGVLILHSYYEGITWTGNITRGILLEQGQDLFPGVPIDFCAVNGYNPLKHKNNGRQLTGVVENIDIEEYKLVIWGVVLFVLVLLSVIIILIWDVLLRRRAERALQESEARFRRLAENAKDMIYRMSLPDGTYEYISPAATEIFGYSPEEWYASPQLIQQIIHPDWHEYFAEQWDKLIHGVMPPFYEYQIVHKSGAVRWCNQRNVLISDDAGNPVAIEGIVTDITERKQAEEALQESERRFSTFMEYLPANVTIKDHDSRFLFASKHMRALFDTEKWRGKTASEYFPPELAEKVLATDRQAFEHGPLVFEETVPIKTGETRIFETRKFPIKQEGKPDLIGIISLDITERKFAETAIRESEERYRRLVELSPDAITLTDLQGKILMANQRSVELYGYQCTDELVGKELFQLIVPEERRRAREDARQTLRTELLRNIEYTMRRKNGDRFMAELNVSVIMDTNGEPTAFISVVRDITERKQIEENIRKLNEELEFRVHQRTAELEAINKELNDFAYVVSHDLKAPLRGISRLADWLAADYADVIDEKGKEMAALLIGRVTRMDNLIDGILDYSRIGRLEQPHETIALAELLKEVLDLLNPPNHIQVIVDPELPMIVASRIRIMQVFQNLIGNAIRFMDKPQGEIRIQFQDDRQFWTFRVIDNGPGIEERHQERIFQIFQTLHPRDEIESTGTGLALVKKIVELYGGKVWVESTVGQGSTFVFTIRKKEG